MSVIPFLNNRQLGTKCRAGSKSYNVKLNCDDILSRLVCRSEKLYSVRREDSELPPFTCKFRKDSQSDLLAVADEDGTIILYDTRKQNSKAVVKYLTAHENAIFDMCWLPDKPQLISASGDHCAVLWDMSKFKPISVFKKHSGSAKTVDVCPEISAVFATGSRDGSINIWDLREKTSALGEKPAIKICHAHLRNLPGGNGKRKTHLETISSVSAVAFQDSNNLASTGIADGAVKIWDLRRTYVSNPKYMPLPKKQMKYAESYSAAHGCTSLVFDSSYKYLYACSTANIIFQFDCHSFCKTMSVYEGSRCSTYYVKLALSRDDQYLLCGSSDHKAYIWKTSKPGLPILQLHGHTAEVTSVCWSPYDITKLATCGDDNKVAIWEVSNIENLERNLVHAMAEPFSESLEIRSPLHQDEVPSSTVSAVLNQKSPEVVQMPSKPVIRAITSFFSPITSSPTTQQLSPKDSTSFKDINGSSTNILCRAQKNSPESSVLTPCNHINKMNIIPQSAVETPEKYSSPDPSIASTSFQKSSSPIKNKENANKSPEDLKRRNSLGQTKRKFAPKHFTPSIKRIQSDSAIKTKGSLKNVSKNKAVTGKTIMNYFSVRSPDN